ncbi:3703_t:CDS:2 [Dentiscutata erythropus]|uniref:3703_t:CDS:1 n=1 Tax=Dentiscutata erythropus TaxID=1348616 RepID=A0A9N9BF52_9GLOM|nr:3703_t:CDS:2 [Dentiscutata erythropus]
MKPGKLSKLEAHLALKCSYIDKHVRQTYLLRVAHYNKANEVESNILIASKKINRQFTMSSFFPQKEGSGLSDGQINLINNALIKAFVVCGIPFSVIENPFFIDLLQSLYPSYQPLSRRVLANKLLNQEHSKIIIKQEAVFKESSNLTIDKIEYIINEIENDKFAAIVSDNASNIKLARQIIYKKYPNILNFNCIAHCANLIFKDILSKY